MSQKKKKDSDSDTDSDDDEPFIPNYNRQAELDKEVEELKKNQKVGRALRQRSLQQALVPKKVPRNGHCLYIAIFRATKDKGLLPGSKFKEEKWRTATLKMRQEMLSFLEKGKNDLVRQIIESGLFTLIYNRIKAPIKSDGTLQEEVDDTLWAGEHEIRIIQHIYRLYNLVILRKSDAMMGVYGDNKISGSTTILLYTGNHYEWAKVRNWTTFVQQPPSPLQLKF